MKKFKDKQHSDVTMVQDEVEKHKYYMVLDGYIVGVQYNLGSE